MSRGVAQRGLLVRHLVLPEGLAGTAEIVRFLRDEVSPNTYINVMAQYRPCYRAHELPPLDRRLTGKEYAEAVRLAQEAGLRLDERRPRLMLGLALVPRRREICASNHPESQTITDPEG